MKLASSPIQEFLDHHARAGIAELVVAEHVGDGVLGFLQRHRHDHAFAGRQAVGLDHDRRADMLDVFQRVGFVFEHRVMRGRDVVAGQEILGEGLAAFQLRGRLAGSENLQAVLLE